MRLSPFGQIGRARGFGLAMAELRSGLAEVAAWQGKAAGRIVVGAMPLSRAHRSVLEAAESAGLGALDNSAIIRVLTSRAGPNDPK